VSNASKGGESGKGGPKRECEGGKGNGGAKRARVAGKGEQSKGGPQACADSNASERSERSEPHHGSELIQPSMSTPQENSAPAEAPAPTPAATPAFANMKAAAAKATLEAARKAELKSKKKKGKASKVRRVPIEAILGPLNYDDYDDDGAAATEKADDTATTLGDVKGTHPRATLLDEAPLEASAEKTAMPSVAEDAAAWGVDPRLLAALQAQGVQHFFPVQRQVIPETLAASRRPALCARDVCVGAATGSGKTLVFVVTVLQALLGRRVPRIRALVVLPSRSLALQVRVSRRTSRSQYKIQYGQPLGKDFFVHLTVILACIGLKLPTGPLNGGNDWRVCGPLLL
jgi:hypothetical protein